MKILHLCLSNFYIDEYAYQENMLTKYHKLLGHDVTIIASTVTFDKKTGKPTLTNVNNYKNEHGIEVKRIPYRFSNIGKFLNDKIRIYKDTIKYLDSVQPDLIFCHGVQLIDLFQVTKYIKKNPKCRLVVDSHAAYINSGQTFLSKYILHKFFYSFIYNANKKYIDKFFVVTPGSLHFANELYNVPLEKMEILYLGADTESINLENKVEVRKMYRKENNIENSDIVLISGGKIDKLKNIIWLVDSFKKISNKKLKLILFGPINPSIKTELLHKISEDSRIIYKSWLSPEEVSKYYLAADIGIFPGSKSALWEQAICCGLPLICKYWEDMDYVDVGGNCIFIDGQNFNELKEAITSLVDNKSKYEKMKNIALTKGIERFSYSNIAKQSLK